jgi:hypothetical protein
MNDLASPADRTETGAVFGIGGLAKGGCRMLLHYDLIRDSRA